MTKKLAFHAWIPSVLRDSVEICGASSDVSQSEKGLIRTRLIHRSEGSDVTWLF